ncbi:MAG TPA: hypothetical protein VK279_06170 [Solirubrobacteraceae bacterium]|nr:hypothetical protein [Solirubrobacteraceae bacterium]
MAEVILPTRHTAGERLMAERVAAALDLDELVVCWSARGPSPETTPSPPASALPAPALRMATLVSEVAIGLTQIWDAVRLTARGR